MLITLLTLIISLSVSLIAHIISYFIRHRLKFIVIGSATYQEFNTWHKSKDYITANPDEYQIFVFEKNEYTFITNSNCIANIKGNNYVASNYD